MPSVLHIAQPTHDGVAAYVTQLCADQAARGWNVVAACPEQGSLAAQLRSRGIRQLNWEARRAPGPGTVAESVRLRRLLDTVCPEVLHLHSSKAGMAGRLAAHGDAPTLFQPHGWSWLAAPPWMVRAVLQWERYAARWTNRFVCVGEGEARQGHEHLLRGQYSVVRNGVDLQVYQPAGERDRAAARGRLGIPPDVPLAVCVGRITRQKGQDVLLSAWPAVAARCPDAYLALAGDGVMLEALRHRSSAEVLFPGRVADPRPWYDAADVVVLPSRWEGLPLTLLEALAVGRPVVGSDIAGIAEELPPGAGALVPPGDAGALATALAQRLRRRDLARAEGEFAARYAAQTADVRRTHDAIADITAQVAAARG
jgi:glycosyltransferase involved in cell wall biosynthesis